MVIPELEAAVQHYFTRGLAPSTHKTYKSGITKFIQFCNQYHVASPLPVSQSLFCYFAAYLATSGLSPGTIKTYLAAVRHLQIAQNLPDPRQVAPMAKLRLVEAGAKKEYGRPIRLRRPITPSILRQIRELWAPRASEGDIIMLWAASCLCFFGFFRMGEITTPSEAQFDPQVHLTIDDSLGQPRKPTSLANTPEAV